MMSEIRVLHPGLFTSIQDHGRFGYRQYGVPEGGSMDSAAAALANLLLQQDPNAAVMEITQQGPKLEFHGPAQIVITGGELSPQIDGISIKNNKVYYIEAGQILSFGKRNIGYRAYLGIGKGFQTEVVLGSRSWYTEITPYSRFEAGMKLPFLAAKEKRDENFSAVRSGENITSELVEAFPGPEYQLLSDSEKNMLQESLFSVGRNSSRMGIQLEEILNNELQPIITAPVIPGTVQLTPSGKIIALMKDAQTTGGYPRILQLTEAGIGVLAQKVPGEKVMFRLLENYLLG